MRGERMEEVKPASNQELRVLKVLETDMDLVEFHSVDLENTLDVVLEISLLNGSRPPIIALSFPLADVLEHIKLTADSLRLDYSDCYPSGWVYYEAWPKSYELDFTEFWSHDIVTHDDIKNGLKQYLKHKLEDN